MKGTDVTMKEMDQVDRTVLGTVWVMYPKKSIAFDFNNATLQRSTTYMSHFMFLLEYKTSLGWKLFLTDNPVCSPAGPHFRLALLFEKIIRMPSFFLFIM